MLDTIHVEHDLPDELRAALIQGNEAANPRCSRPFKCGAIRLARVRQDDQDAPIFEVERYSLHKFAYLEIVISRVNTRPVFSKRPMADGYPPIRGIGFGVR